MSRRSGIVFAGFFALAVLTSHPLSSRPSEVLPGNADGLYFSWATAWIGHQLPRDPAELFAANIYHPDRAALLYGEPILGVGLLALPLWALSGDAAVTYNYAFVITLALSAFFMFLLALELTGHAAAAVIAGEVFAFTTANYDSAARLQIVSAQWTPLLLYFLVRLWRRGRLRDGIGMGLAAAMQGLSCNYHTLYLATVLVVTLPLLLWLLPSPRGRRLPWRGLLAGVALSAAVLAPVYVAQHRNLGRISSERPLRVGALPQTSYWNVLPTNWLYGGRIGQGYVSYDDRYFFGNATLLLALLGLAAWARRRPAAAAGDRGRLLGYFLAFGLVALLLGCGKYLPLWGAQLPGPYAWLHAWVPGFDQTRVPSRFVMLLRVSVALFAAAAVADAAARLAGRRRLARGLWLAAAVLVPLEHVSTPLEAWELPVAERLPDVYRFLPTLPEGAPILEYPQNPSRGRRWESLWLNLATRHWRPIVNGFGAHYPPAHYFVQDQLVGTFPNVDSLRMLRALGVRYVVFHPDYGIFPETREAADRFERKLPRYRQYLELVESFDDRRRFDDAVGVLGGERVYRVLPVAPPETRLETDDWPRLPRRGWVCELSWDDSGCQAAHDGRADTVVSTRRFQRVGDAVRLRFRRPLRLRGVSIPVGRFPHEYPRQLQILGRVGQDWYNLADWNTLDSVEFVRDLLADPDRATLDYAFDPVEVGALTLRIGPGTGNVLHPWVLPEIELLAP